MAFPYFKSSDKTVNIGPFNGGVSIDMPMHEIDDTDSPDMLNMIYKNGVLRKRPGQKILFSDDGEDEKMLACFERLYCGHIVYCAGNKLKAYNPDSNVITDMGIRTSSLNGEFFSYNGKLYYTGSGEYYRISEADGELKAETVEGYVPLRYINCDPQTGFGDENESLNFLTPCYRATYNTKENMTKLYLPPGALCDKSKISLKYNGEEMKENSYVVTGDGCVEFEQSFVSFKEGHNNLTVYLSDAEGGNDRRKISYCNISAVFGGSSSGLSEGTRVFLSGNEDCRNMFFKSGLRNPEYFPIDGYEILGDETEKITAFGRQGGGLVIFKENSIYISLYDYSSGEALFTVTNISPDLGCDLKNTVKTVNNALTWMHSRHGVLTLSSISKNSGKNVSVISGKINGSGSEMALLGKDDYSDASAFVYDGKYHLCAGKLCYVLHYGSGNGISWYLYSDISCAFSVLGKKEVYIASKDGRFTYFSDCLYDFSKDNPICAHYVTKAFTLGNSTLFKTIKDISLYLKADKNTYVEIKCIDENGELKRKESYKVNKFSFDGFCFSDFTFLSRRFAVFLRRKLSRRRVKFFALELRNHNTASDMAVSSMTVTFKYERGVKVNGI